jgi:hypothetical protein
MRTFAKKQNQPQPESSTSLTRANTWAPAASQATLAFLNSQPTVGNQGARRSLAARADRVEADSNNENGPTSEVDFETRTSTPFAHDFTRIPVHAPAPITIQRKLTVNTPGDIYEQEAERITDQVMAKPAHHAVSGAPPHVQRLAQQPTGGEDAAPASVYQALATPGRPLEPALRQDMEQRFGHGFSKVRVHTGSAAEQSAQDVNAHAFTLGDDIVFGVGRFEPTSHEGRRLIAHELTHTVQQGQVANTIQRSLKFEFQTNNHVWAVKNSGAPDPRLLPRKYAPTTVGYKEGSGEERGDQPAYLSVGQKGGPARKKGEVVFVEAEGPLAMEEAKSGIDPNKGAQFVKEYKFKTQVKIKDITDKPVAPEQLVLVNETDNSKIPAMSGNFNPNTFEFKYFNADGTQLDLHLSKQLVFKSGHVKLMKVGRRKRSDIDETKEAQFIEILRVTEVATGDVDFLGKRAKVERASVLDNAKDKTMVGLFNPNTWEKKYFLATNFAGNVLSGTAKPLDVHMDKDGRLKKGQVKFMVKEVTEAKEQTAIELQSENEGVLEFETPKWFRDWSDLKERIEEAVSMTKAINDQRGTTQEVADKTILDAIDKKKNTSTLGQVVEWPALFSTAHLKNLRADKRRLLVQITDPVWLARIQASEGIPLSEYKSLMQEHEEPWVKDIVIPTADNIFATAFQAAKLKKSTLNESLFANLKGFLQLIATYIVRGQVQSMTGQISKSTFMLMARTDFGSMYKVLSADEQALFKTIVGDPKKASDNPILTALEPSINVERGKRALAALSLTRKSPFFFAKVGTHKGSETFGPALYDWLRGITNGIDLLSGPGISDAMGAKSVQDKPGDKDFERAQFEVRGTVAHGGAVSPGGTVVVLGNDQPAANWLSFARGIFESAKTRAADTPDDPTTPKVESSKTGLKE